MMFAAGWTSCFVLKLWRCGHETLSAESVKRSLSVKPLNVSKTSFLIR